jgi:predicted amidohydrolase YtcJ
LILRNGRVFTPAGGATSIGVRGERIVAVGSDDSVAALAGPATTVLDLDGRLVIPGVNDAHDHIGEVPFGRVVSTATPPMADPPLEEVMAAVARASADPPDTEWIQAVVGPSILSNPATPAALTRAAGNHPAILTAWWGHGAVANGAGLRAMHIPPDAVDPPGGHYERDAAGRLTGKMEEYARWDAMEQLYTSAGQEAIVANFRAYAARRLREGVTSVQIMSGDIAPGDFIAALKTADLPLRLRLLRFLHPDRNGIGLDRWKDIPAHVAARIEVSGTKVVVDDIYIEQLAFRGGRLNFEPEFIRARLNDALVSREPLALHVTGDATSDLVLTQMELLAPADRWQALRVRIEHGNITGDRVDRAKKLGIVIAQPRPAAPFRSWLTAGIPVAYGSDSRFPPFVVFMQMVSPGPNSISREEALRVLTWGPAYAQFKENEKGAIAVGMLADLAVLSQDVLSVPVQVLPATTSVLTVVGGQIAYDSQLVTRVRLSRADSSRGGASPAVAAAFYRVARRLASRHSTDRRR